MYMWVKHQKSCATCIYWNCKREVDFYNIKVYCEEGNCYNPDGFYKIKTMQGDKCSKWVGFSK
ncbi:hypothetical protein [Clostridium grantii]|uniref:Uncharacterized protein n=1 Tax=Clostridium grantii DSM 8605 TaxID=1121316 RepID=A0A1M5XR26_9CLOT|nr:hypothetical protein [Clostridium grantii]SHI02206.1 hypothetical protein SAMN02745207_03864 [Clostridium grantii DSM 8605]